jgi:small subunit ribosomal protein S20
MPNSPSAIKRLKQSKKRRLRNRIAKKVIRTYSKRAMAAATAKNFDQAEADFRFAVARIDRAGIRRILHPNTANRRKSALTKLYLATVAKAKATA